MGQAEWMQRVEWTFGLRQQVLSWSKMEGLAWGQESVIGIVVIVLGADEPPVIDVAYFDA